MTLEEASKICYGDSIDIAFTLWLGNQVNEGLIKSDLSAEQRQWLKMAWLDGYGHAQRTTGERMLKQIEEAFEQGAWEARRP